MGGYRLVKRLAKDSDLVGILNLHKTLGIIASQLDLDFQKGFLQILVPQCVFRHKQTLIFPPLC